MSPVINSELLKHAVFGVLGGCCTNVYTLELLIKEAKNASILITFSQFAAVIFLGILLNSRLVRKKWIVFPILRKPHIPLRNWIIPSSIFTLVSLLNNLALEYNVPLPLHIVIRSSSLPTSLIMSYLLTGKKTRLARIVSVIFVSIGILSYTYISMSENELPDLNNFQYYDLSQRQVYGILLLMLTIVLFGVVSLIQEKIYSRWGKHWKEGLLYLHLFGILQFLIYKNRVIAEYKDISMSESVDASVFCSLYRTPRCISLASSDFVSSIRVPRLLIYVILNGVTQAVCVSGVNGLTSMVTPVTLNLILTFRKFASLLLSVVLFKNIFTVQHFITSSMVIAGTLAYGIFRDNPSVESATPEKKEK